MLVSYNWLADYVDLSGLSGEDLANGLTMAGIETTIKQKAEPLPGVVIGEVLSAEQHPAADRLRLCQVNIGAEETAQIVCGAPNVVAGAKVPVATIGSRLPDGLKIKKAKLRGVESQGMICSESEIGLKIKSDGIMILEQTAEIGSSVSDYLGLNDEILELELTPNRTDCLGIFGVAHEIAAIFERELKFPALDQHTSSNEAVLSCSEHNLAECYGFAHMLVDRFTVAPSPRWLQNRLLAVGLQPVNNAHDIANYVMLETGQPIQVLTAAASDNLAIRYATADEELVTRDGTSCNSLAGLLVLASEQPLALAGILEGEMVTEQDNKLLFVATALESTVVRKAVRQTGVRTEASSRSEKGLLGDKIFPALMHCATLCKQLLAEADIKPINVRIATEPSATTITLRHQQVEQTLGINLEHDKVIAIFKRLRFGVSFDTAQATYSIEVPTRRPDISLPIDLIEEIARLYGYHLIEPRLFAGQQRPGGLSAKQRWTRTLRATLQNHGFHEVITYSLRPTAEKHPSLTNRTTVELTHPISSEYASLRTTLIPSLLETADYNWRHGNPNISLFELGNIYLPTDDGLPQEKAELVGLAIPQSFEASLWKKETSIPHFYHLKGIIEALLHRLGFGQLKFSSVIKDGWHPGQTAEIFIEQACTSSSQSKTHAGVAVGLLGQLHPQLAATYNLPATFLFQLDWHQIISLIKQETSYVEPSKFPAMTRDISLIVDEKLSARDLEEGIWSSAGEILEKVYIFDLFQGEQVAADKKALAYSLTYRSIERTLTEDEVDAMQQNIIQTLKNQFGAELR